MKTTPKNQKIWLFVLLAGLILVYGSLLALIAQDIYRAKRRKKLYKQNAAS